MTAIPNQVRNYLNLEDDILPLGHGFLLKYLNLRDAKNLLLTSKDCASTVIEYKKEKEITSPEYHQTMKDGRPITKFKIGTNWFELPFHVKYIRMESNTTSFFSLINKSLSKIKYIYLYANNPPIFNDDDDTANMYWKYNYDFRCECSEEDAKLFKKALKEDEPARIFYAEKERVRKEKEKAEAIKQAQIARNTFAVRIPSKVAPWAKKIHLK